MLNYKKQTKEIQMFNLSFGEITLVIILAIIFLKPSDIPIIIKKGKKAFAKILTLKNNLLDEIDELKDDFKNLEEELLEQDKIIKKDNKNDRT